MLLAFVALARPKFGSGTRIVPATNLDVVIVLDYSKSMYARDIVPSRIARAKAEVARLIQDLPGARFGAVAFAGEPMSFPLTSDGAAIAQFFRQLDPNDMPVGGTATARALERAREVFARDPKSKDHVRVIVLVTDGEDLEGDPVSVAAELRAARGRASTSCRLAGARRRSSPRSGRTGRSAAFGTTTRASRLTTELSAEGEAQLARVAQTTGGTIVRAEHGETGIDRSPGALQKMMREELSEKVETVYAEEYAWPLGIAVLLLLADALIGEARAPPAGHGRGEGMRPLRCLARSLLFLRRVRLEPIASVRQGLARRTRSPRRSRRWRRVVGCGQAGGLPLHRRLQGRQHRHPRPSPAAPRRHVRPRPVPLPHW